MGSATSTEEDLTNMDTRYARRHILTYEWVWGQTWVSPGGREMTKELLDKVPILKEKGPACSSLDVGCGSGGAAFFMASEYGCKVKGVDIAKDMVALCEEYRAELAPGVKFMCGADDRIGSDRVQFQCADIMSSEVELGTYDFIWSRDTFLHIADKEGLFAKLYSLLNPGGMLLFTDYCKSGKKPEDMSEEFQHYMTKKGYTLVEPEAGYGELVKAAGFVDVKATDASKTFRAVLQKELKFIENGKEDFLAKFTQQEYDDLISGWSNKIKWVGDEDMKWGNILAKRA